jgi:hypothetical protein
MRSILAGIGLFSRNILIFSSFLTASTPHSVACPL